MSDTDSFIDEVSEEVRREKLYGYLKRYGWIGVLAVLLLVGGAAYNEWRKASDAEAAQAMGDTLLDALDIEDAEARAAAMAAVEPSADAVPIVALLTATEQENAGDIEGAVATLDALAANGDVLPEYRDLARIKSLVLSDGILEDEARRTALDDMARAGQPYRMLALEQLALMDVAAGETEAALDALQAIIADAEVSGGMLDRAQALIEALGGETGGEDQ